jgi:thiamine kinase-like enzyme
VHALLEHLNSNGFAAAPRALGIDDQGREIIEYIEGDVVWPGRFDLLETDDALAAVARLIARYHRLVRAFPHRDYEWARRGADPSGSTEVLCHSDFAPWNLVHRDGTWTFIDWDLAAPGRCTWDTAWALLSFVPLTPDRPLGDAAIGHRLAVFKDAYGGAASLEETLAVAVERSLVEAQSIKHDGGRLLAEGHADIWAAAAERVAAHAARWCELVTRT